MSAPTFLFPLSCDCVCCEPCEVTYTERACDTRRCPECDGPLSPDPADCTGICLIENSLLAEELDARLAALPGDELVAVRFGAGSSVPEDHYEVVAESLTGWLSGSLAADLTVEVGERSAELHGAVYHEVRSADTAFGLLVDEPSVPCDELLHICAAAADADVDLASAVHAAEANLGPWLPRDGSWLPVLAALSLGDAATNDALRRLEDPSVQAALIKPVHTTLSLLRPGQSSPEPEPVAMLLEHAPGVVTALCGDPDYVRLIGTYRALRTQERRLLDPGRLRMAGPARPALDTMVGCVRELADHPHLTGPFLAALRALVDPTDPMWAHTEGDLCAALAAARASL